MRALLATCLLIGCAAGRSDLEPFDDPILETALKAIGWTTADFSIRSDRLDDADRLMVTRQLLERPAEALKVVRALRGDTVADLLKMAGVLLDVRLETDAVSAPSDLPEPLPGELRDLVFALGICRMRVDAAFAAFSMEERKRLEQLIALVDRKCALSEREMVDWIALGRRVDRGRLLFAAAELMQAVDRFVDHRPDLAPGRFETPAGWVIVGTAGEDTYEMPAALIVDPGGNDRYAGSVGVARGELQVSVCIDLGGDDVYEGAQALGFAGVGVLADVWGDDRYSGEGAGQGCGVAGVGILDDRSGDDVYSGGLGAQGFGLYGVGILRDGIGRDIYAGALLVQGAAGPGGAGLLADGAGDDVYEAGGVYRDFREDGRIFQSMAQGFGLGVRPLTSGGAGVLLDVSGDDVYRVDYFGQGAAFWGGSGLLIDFSGHDRYEARRYGQGAGVHLAAGLLLDAAGNDAYTLWGVGQGCGHDLAVGMLLDLLGNDQYDADWLAQGAGSANGIGWLDDGAGDDRYAAERSDAQGYGAPARDYDSLGLLIDRSGADAHSGLGSDGTLWIGGRSGVGIDWPLGEKR